MSSFTFSVATTWYSINLNLDLVQREVGERRVDPVAGADEPQVVAGQVAMRMDPVTVCTLLVAPLHPYPPGSPGSKISIFLH